MENMPEDKMSDLAEFDYASYDMAMGGGGGGGDGLAPGFENTDFSSSDNSTPVTEFNIEDSGINVTSDFAPVDTQSNPDLLNTQIDLQPVQQDSTSVTADFVPVETLSDPSVLDMKIPPVTADPSLNMSDFIAPDTFNNPNKEPVETISSDVSNMKIPSVPENKPSILSKIADGLKAVGKIVGAGTGMAAALGAPMPSSSGNAKPSGTTPLPQSQAPKVGSLSLPKASPQVFKPLPTQPPPSPALQVGGFNFSTNAILIAVIFLLVFALVLVRARGE